MKHNITIALSASHQKHAWRWPSRRRYSAVSLVTLEVNMLPTLLKTV